MKREKRKKRSWQFGKKNILNSDLGIKIVPVPILLCHNQSLSLLCFLSIHHSISLLMPHKIIIIANTSITISSDSGHAPTAGRQTMSSFFKLPTTGNSV